MTLLRLYWHHNTMRMTRRKFLKFIGLGLAGMAAATSSSVLYVTQLEPAWFHVHHQPLHLPRMKGDGLVGLRIVQISDIHIGGWMNRARLDRVVDLSLAQKPDLVAITGDFVTRFTDKNKDLADLAVVLNRLNKAVPTFYVMGNHDYWFGAAPLRSALEDAGIQELRNSVKSFRRGGSVLHLAGVDDIYARRDRLSLVLDNLPPDDPAILMAHEPDYADISAKNGRFDLQISGHTHGGQVWLPFVGAPILPYLGKKYPSGLYRVGEMWQYTNRGVGMASIEVRFNCPPEITVFTLQ